MSFAEARTTDSVQFYLDNISDIFFRVKTQFRSFKIKSWFQKQNTLPVNTIHYNIKNARIKLMKNLYDLPESVWNNRPGRMESNLKEEIIELILLHQHAEKVIRTLNKGETIIFRYDMEIDQTITGERLLAMLNNEFTQLDKTIPTLEPKHYRMTYFNRDHGTLDVKGWLAYILFIMNAKKLKLQKRLHTLMLMNCYSLVLN